MRPSRTVDHDQAVDLLHEARTQLAYDQTHGRPLNPLAIKAIRAILTPEEIEGLDVLHRGQAVTRKTVLTASHGLQLMHVAAEVVDGEGFAYLALTVTGYLIAQGIAAAEAQGL